MHFILFLCKWKCKCRVLVHSSTFQITMNHVLCCALWPVIFKAVSDTPSSFFHNQLCDKKKKVTCSQKDIEGSWVPSQDSHSFTVSLKSHNGLSHWTRQAPVWDLPNLQSTKHSRGLFVNVFVVMYDGSFQVHKSYLCLCSFCDTYILKFFSWEWLLPQFYYYSQKKHSTGKAIWKVLLKAFVQFLLW